MKKTRTILTIENAKTSKGESLGYLTGILYLLPEKQFINYMKEAHGETVPSSFTLCRFASAGCKKACLNTAGRGAMNSVQKARGEKTRLFHFELEYFMACLEKSIKQVIRKAEREGLTPCIRLNGTSDILWENVTNHLGKNVFELFPDVQFYDYTVNPKRPKALKGFWPNYHLTFSRKESRANHKHCEEVLKLGVNVAAVYRSDFPADSIDGDQHDLRFLDGKQGKIIALKAKGKAKKDTSGFVIDYVREEQKAA